jgi:hypothetical protein
LGYADLDLRHILRVNDYEGIRLGCGFWTSDKISPWINLGGYAGYGIKDKAWKYGGMLQLNFNRAHSAYMLAEASSEVVETAGTSFLDEQSDFTSGERFRELMIKRMDKLNSGKVSVRNNFFNGLNTSLYIQAQERISPFGYLVTTANAPASEINKFNINEAGLQVKFWPGEKFSEGLGNLFSLGSRWPVFSANVARGIAATIAGNAGTFQYTKVDLRINHRVNFKVKGYIAWQLQAGQVFGRVPYSLQYNNKGSFSTRYYISAENTFETMGLNEFISTRYAAIFFSINTGKLFHPNKYVNPEFELVHNYGIGSLEQRNDLTNIPLNDISRGYTEAGLRIRNIYRLNLVALGAGIYYRYGNYAHPDPKDNFVFKLVIGFSF